MRELRSHLHSTMAAGRNRKLPLQRMRPVQGQQRGSIDDEGHWSAFTPVSTLTCHAPDSTRTSGREVRRPATHPSTNSLLPAAGDAAASCLKSTAAEHFQGTPAWVVRWLVDWKSGLDVVGGWADDWKDGWGN